MAPVADLHDLYERMLVIRRFEETVLEMFSAGELVGTTHAYIGQEAGAVGIIAHLDPARDVVFSNHRCHGHYIAFTDDVEGLFAEVMGRADGVCGGKGGSQHLCRGNFYSNGVQGSIVPVAAGMALAEKAKGTGAVVVVFLGDGTLGQGTVYESLNMAALWRLPILFVVENNHYAQTTPIELAVAGSIPARGAAFGIATTDLDTTDVGELHAAAGAVIERIRTTGEPSFLVLDTYRFAPHSKGDETRDPAEIAAQRPRDPLRVVRDRLDPARLDATAEAAAHRVAEARAAAEAAPMAGVAAP
jgi:acetoin:2,6-dichlorophenolindophenol oxidoreductase subunit alpha